MFGNVSEGSRRVLTPLLRSLAMAVLAILLVLAVPGVGAAQTLYGTLVGNVKDPTGAVVPGATVTVVQTDPPGENRLARRLHGFDPIRRHLHSQSGSQGLQDLFQVGRGGKH